MSGLRVLMLTPVFPRGEHSAEGLFNELQARALSELGCRVTVIVPKPYLPNTAAHVWKRYSALADLPRRDNRHGLNVIYCRYLHIPRYRMMPWTVRSCTRAILSALRQSDRCEQFDLLQVHSVWPVGLASAPVTDGLGLPLVVTLHIQDDTRLRARRAGKSLFDAMLQRANALVAVGSPLARPYDGHLAAQKLSIIPNGVALDRVEEVIGERGCQPPGDGRIVSVCNLWPSKGIDLNLRALARLDALKCRWARYTIVGDGPDRRRLEDLTQELGIEDRVVFTGRLSHREVLQEIARADVFSLPSRPEAFGVVYLEAMACGRPAIGIRGQGAEDIIREGVDGLLVEPGDVDSLAAALGQLLRVPERTAALGREARSRAKQFTWKRNAQQYLDLYNSLRKSNRAQSSDALQG